MRGDLREHIEDDVRSGAFPEFEGLRSVRLSEQVYAQYDEHTGTLLVAGLDWQKLLERDEVEQLAKFLLSL